jgi:predicted kinase/GNAT superfamily N-acetyltransferase
MQMVRPYTDNDWEAVLEICLLSFAPIHESFKQLLGAGLFALVYPDWKTSHKEYLASLTQPGERERLHVAEDNRSVVGFIHYEVDRQKQSGKIGLNAVHPTHQSKGIGSRMYRYVLDKMRTEGMKYVQVETGGDASHAPARRAYEKAGFVPIPVVHYFKDLLVPETFGTKETCIRELETRPRLVVACGLPGSGKTSDALLAEQNLQAIRFCADEWMEAAGINLWESEARKRIEALQWAMAKRILRLGGNVVIEWGSWARSERDVLRIGARQLGAAVELHFLDAPVEVLFERIRRRNAETPAITLDDLQKWDQMLERPTTEEMALFDEPIAAVVRPRDLGSIA